MHQTTGEMPPRVVLITILSIVAADGLVPKRCPLSCYGAQQQHQWHCSRRLAQLHQSRIIVTSATSDSKTPPARWDQLLTAMRLYHEYHGDLCIELGWKVPASPPWPESLWDEKLAKIIYHIDFWQQFVAAVPSRRAELDEIGFLWSRLQPEYVQLRSPRLSASPRPAVG